MIIFYFFIYAKNPCVDFELDKLVNQAIQEIKNTQLELMIYRFDKSFEYSGNIFPIRTMGTRFLDKKNIENIAVYEYQPGLFGFKALTNFSDNGDKQIIFWKSSSTGFGNSKNRMSLPTTDSRSASKIAMESSDVHHQDVLAALKLHNAKKFPNESGKLIDEAKNIINKERNSAQKYTAHDLNIVQGFQFTAVKDNLTSVRQFF